jgi:hypothetical protein
MNDLTNETIDQTAIPVTEIPVTETPAPIQPMSTVSLREMAMQSPRKQEDVPTPFWTGTDGHFAIADVPMKELVLLRPLAKSDSASYTAAIIIKALINKFTGEQAFSDADRDWLATQASICMTLIGPINIFFGFDTKAAVEAAKNA